MWGCSIIAIGAPALITTNALGSGIPEMKCILSGATFRRYLSMGTFVAKLLSITFATGSGTSLLPLNKHSLTKNLKLGLLVGKVGPFAHIGAIIVNLLSKVPLFYYVRKVSPTYSPQIWFLTSHSCDMQNSNLYQQMLDVGCGLGLVITLGSPIGGE